MHNNQPQIWLSFLIDKGRKVSYIILIVRKKHTSILGKDTYSQIMILNLILPHRNIRLVVLKPKA